MIRVNLKYIHPWVSVSFVRRLLFSLFFCFQFFLFIHCCFFILNSDFFCFQMAVQGCRASLLGIAGIIFYLGTETCDCQCRDACSEKRRPVCLASCLSTRSRDWVDIHTIDFVCKLRFFGKVVFFQCCRVPIHTGQFRSMVQNLLIYGAH